MEGGNGATVGSEVTLRRAESAIGLKGGNAVSVSERNYASPLGERWELQEHFMRRLRNSAFRIKTTVFSVLRFCPVQASADSFFPHQDFLLSLFRANLRFERSFNRPLPGKFLFRIPEPNAQAR